MKFTHVNSVQVSMDTCLSEVVCMYVYGIQWTLILKLRTCDIVRSSGCVLYIRGWVKHCSLFIYFIFICITVFLLRFCWTCVVWLWYTSKIECNSCTDLVHFVWNYWVSIFVNCDCIYLLLNFNPNLFSTNTLICVV